jgi:hypothetical protein
MCLAALYGATSWIVFTRSRVLHTNVRVRVGSDCLGDEGQASRRKVRQWSNPM